MRIILGGRFISMIKIKIVCVGKIKESYFTEGVKEYEKRLSRFCQFQIKELKEENFNDNPTESDIQAIIKKEGESILKELKGEVILMDIQGKQYSSVDFSSLIKSNVDTGKELIFVIGGSYGVSEEVKSKATSKISFSKMTFPHTMFRVMLVEQIYRAFTIINGAKYHK